MSNYQKSIKIQVQNIKEKSYQSKSKRKMRKKLAGIPKSLQQGVEPLEG